ncbi:MAG TPA: acyl-CoA dehydrogenase family protein [Mycobacterium sp.]|jgi:3-hydroxy-9,10-secoandrosta-1,3,5(10)-triene-9,17-dione monooxygenase|nr:acyl-CoA dehydrogenase family protein [Mycobacterium sp.]
MSTAIDAITIPTREELVSRARGLQPLLREHAATGETERKASDAVIDGVTAAGFFRLLSPQQFGGYEVDVRTVLEISELLGQADGSVAWLVGLGATATWLAAHFPDRARSEVFADNGDARIAGAATPGPARRVEGGLRVSGRWGYASGSPHATWAGVIAMLTDESGRPGDAYWCLIPASDLRLEDTWRTTGMRGTGSNTWVGEDVFVPDYRTILMDAVSKEALPAPSDSPMYRLPFPTLATLALLGPILGVASAALTYTIEKAPTKTMHHTIFTNQSDSVGVQVQIAEAALKLETARLHMYAVADQLDRAAVDDRHIDYDERAKARAQGGYAAQQMLDAINILVNVHGAGSFAESSPLQRYWRDANTAARHAGLYPVVGYEIFGKSLLGVDDQISPMV